MNSKSLYTTSDVLSYFFAVTGFIFFGIFAIADIDQEKTHILIKTIKLLAVFPYVLLLNSMFDFLKSTWTHEDEETQEVIITTTFLALAIIAVTVALILISTQWIFNPITPISSKIGLLLGLTLHLFIHMTPKK